MSFSKNDVASLFESTMRAVLRHSTWTEERDVLWGNASGQFIVANPIHQREVYWHSLSTENQEVGVAILDGDCNLLYQENADYAANPPRITLGYPPRSTVLHVKGIAKTQEGNAAQGTLTQTEQFIARIGNPFITNIIDFHVQPTDGASTSVYAEAGMYEKPSALGVKQRWLGGTLDLSAAIVALTSGQHQLAAVYFDTETGTLGFSTTTAVSAIGDLPARADLDSISSVTFSPGQLAVGTIYLYEGQVAVEVEDCLTALDPRFTWPPDNSTSSNLTVTDSITTVTDVTDINLVGLTLTDDGGGSITIAAGTSPGGAFPKRATMWHNDSLVLVGNALGRNITSTWYSDRAYQSPGAINDAFTNGFLLAAGSYTLAIYCQPSTDNGIITWYVDGVSQGTTDHYNGSTTDDRKTLAITVTTDGWHVLEGVVASKNGSSSGYYAVLTQMVIIPSAD